MSKATLRKVDELIALTAMRLLTTIVMIVLLAGCTTGTVKVSGSYTMQAVAAESK
jgi:hypothetical protein